MGPSSLTVQALSLLRPRQGRAVLPLAAGALIRSDGLVNDFGKSTARANVVLEFVLHAEPTFLRQPTMLRTLVDDRSEMDVAWRRQMLATIFETIVVGQDGLKKLYPA